MSLDSVNAQSVKRPKFRRAIAMLVGSVCGVVALSGCTQMPDALSGAFADPAKYDLYNCVQLRTARRENARRIAELRGLIARAETGSAGPVVSEVAYGNDLLTARAAAALADKVWEREKCSSQVLPPEKAAPDPAVLPQQTPSGHVH